MTTWQELQSNPRLKRIYEERLLITKCVREFFWSKGFVEAETPISMRVPGQEPYLNPIKVKMQNATGGEYDFYFRTSPEYALKKLLAAGYEKIFEIAKCFRNAEDFGGTHSPEFTMLEWYQAPGKLEDIMQDSEKLFKYVLKKLGKQNLNYRGSEITISGKWERKSMKQIFKKYLKVNLDEYLEVDSIKKLALKLDLTVSDSDEYEDVFFKIFLNKIEPTLGMKKPIFIYDYPARMCSLSRVSKKDARYAERFELYIGGLEIANAFGELLEGQEQKKKLEVDKDLRAKLGRETWEIDEDFIGTLDELGKRVNEAGGVALGLDRMVILCTDARDINEVIFNNLTDQLENK